MDKIKDEVTKSLDKKKAEDPEKELWRILEYFINVGRLAVLLKSEATR